MEIVNIRKGRPKPGLQPQHLTAVKAAAAISGACVEGDTLSSTELRFLPGRVSHGDYAFDVSEKKGSAGSTSLILQTIMLPLCFAKQASTATVIGGTHVPWSPTFHFLKHVFVPVLSRTGLSVDFDIEKWGWYPQGGGKVMARINRARGPLPVRIVDRGRLQRVCGVSAVSNLPQEIALRQRSAAIKALLQRGIHADMEIISAPSPGRGTLVFLLAEFENMTVGFDSLGAVGKRAETVADEACRAMFEHLDTPGALDAHLADQVIPYLALADGASEFTTSRITQHLLTNAWLIKQFLDVDIRVDGNEGEAGRVWVRPAGNRKVQN